jgi:hypothetical protein
VLHVFDRLALIELTPLSAVCCPFFVLSALLPVLLMPSSAPEFTSFSSYSDFFLLHCLLSEGLAVNALNHRFGKPIPHIDYTPEELATWEVIRCLLCGNRPPTRTKTAHDELFSFSIKAVYDKLQSFIGKFACEEYLKILPLLEQECGYSRDKIPQQV